MPILHVRKIVSLNPEGYIYQRLGRALADYNIYLQRWTDSFKIKRVQGYPKSFSTWLETEI